MGRNYAPEGKYLWDPWFIEASGAYHMFHLQSKRDGDPDGRHHNNVSIGHAISRDLIQWEEQETALSPGVEGSWDGLSLWTGSVFENKGVFFLYYTGRSRNDFWIQKIGIATSSDLCHWKKYAENPVMEADEIHYHIENAKNKLDVAPAWRDPFIFQDPKSKKHYALITARTIGEIQEYNGCIAIVETEDMFNWKPLPPLLAPGRYDEMEVPQMIFFEGYYYLFFSAAAKYYEPTWAKKMGKGHGLHCYFSSELFGKYQPVNGNGIVLDTENLLGLRLIKENGGDFSALGWLNNNKDGDFIGRLSDLMTIRVESENVHIVD